MTKELLDLEGVYERVVGGLDDAKERPPFEQVREIHALTMAVEAKELRIRVRRFDKPFLLAKDVYFRFKLAQVEYRAEPGVLQRDSLETFYGRFPVQGHSEEVEPKLFYDAKFVAERLDAQVRGFDEFHSFL